MSVKAKRLKARSGVRLFLARTVGSIAITSFASASPVHAEAPHPEVVAGYEGSSSNSYAFVSPSFGIEVNESGDLLIKPSIHYLKYQTRENGVETSVRSPGGSLGISYRYHGPKFTLDVGPSIEFIREERRPSAGITSKDNKVGFEVSANAFYQTDRNSTLSLITNYSQTSRYFFSRAGFKTRVSNRDYKGPVGLSFGPELTFQTGHGVKQYGAGAMVEVGLDRTSTSLQFRGGYTRSNFADGTTDSYPYFGAGLYHRF